MSERNFVTVLGIGNILMGDEGFGIHFTRWLSRRYRPNDDIRIIDGARSAMPFWTSFAVAIT